MTRTPPVGLSTSSVYPDDVATCFTAAARLGYDGVEIMVWNDPVSQDADALRDLVQQHGLPVLSVHAPTLLLTQRVWGVGAWGKIDKSIELAAAVGADTVVVHPPFRWQREYAESFVSGVRSREEDSGIALAIENMFPWRAPASMQSNKPEKASREMQVYLPHWDPVAQDYDHVTLDTSHTATAEVDALEMARALGTRLTHLHLADGSGTFKDEHLVPGHGNQRVAEVLEHVATVGSCRSVVVEVGTRKLDATARDTALAESLAFARLHLG